MISFFTTAKTFSGHTNIIQRNALRSWKRLHPDCEVLLLGNDPGFADLARELGLVHVSDIAQNEYGTPLVNDLFAVAHARARHDLLCYVNADIILMQDFVDAAHRVRDLHKPFLMCGRRWKLDITAELPFEPGWEDRLRRDALENGDLDTPKCVDYFLFTRGLFGTIPPFAIGRKRWDRWLQYRARSGAGLLIDATEVVTAIHQNHDYGRRGFMGHKGGPETQRNMELAADQYCDLRRATHKLTRATVRRTLDSVRSRWRIGGLPIAFERQLERLGRLKLVRNRAGRLPRASAVVRRFLKSVGGQRLSRSRIGENSRKKIAVIGLGKVGLPLAVCLAHKGFTVLGADADAEKLTAIQSRKAPGAEMRVQKLLARYGKRLTVQLDAEQAAREAAVIMLVLPTQRPDDRTFTPEHLLSACEAVRRALTGRKSFPLVAVVSTVLPGWTGGIIRSELERAGQRAGRDFGLCYCPQLISLGEAVEGFLSPEFAIIGESDPRAGKGLGNILLQMWDHPAPIIRTNFANAELAKLALNTYVATKISFANVLAQMCERLPDANVDLVTSILAHDHRVGRGYLTGGLSYGGPCFPGDVPAFAAVAEELGASSELALATHCINKQAIVRLVDLVKRTTAPGRPVGICGITFKPGSNVLDGSPGIWIAQQLEAAGYPAVLYDPRQREYAASGVIGAEAATSLADCVRRSDTLVLALPYLEFSGLPIELKRCGGARRTIVDCWRILDPEEANAAANYHALGVGPRPEDAGTASPTLQRSVAANPALQGSRMVAGRRLKTEEPSGPPVRNGPGQPSRWAASPADDRAGRK